ncbi:MAG: ABC transporter permease [Oscillospiraceae bacterium]|jgi:spermidine/putrescine transport system permease protein|nr:ABC transporter permease [Oscillospiraceae bacterium]
MKKTNIFGRLISLLVFIFLYAPIAVLIVLSFNASKSRNVWTGFTLDWYKQLLHNRMIMNALSTTLKVSVLAAVIATVAGTFAAVGLHSMRKRTRGTLLSVNQVPVINADIITGVSMMLLFVSVRLFLGKFNVNFELGFATLLIAHLTFNIPYVILSVMPKLYQLDNSLSDAAMDLGANWITAFRKVIIPEIRPGIVNGMLIAFTMSIDDFVISYFTAGSHVQTLSMTIYSMTRRRISPEINALSTLLFGTVLVLLAVVNLRQRRAAAKLEKSEKPD